MAQVVPILNSFASGEWSPLLDGRTDVQRYYSAAKTIENYIPLPYGGLKRRPGTYHVAEVKDSTRKTYLRPFQFSITQAYIVEFGNRYLRFYANNGQVLSSGSAYELTSPYLEADLPNLQYAQDADTMWITHPSYKTRKLTRNAATWDSYTKLMLHCNGTDAATTFTDEISKTMTAQGNAQIDTAQNKFGSASGLFDGTGDYLTTPDHADWYFGTGDFTIDFRVRFNSLPGTDTDLMGQYEDANNHWYLAVSGTTGKLRLRFMSGGVDQGYYEASSGLTLATGVWYHFAFVRSGTSALILVDGVSQALTETTAFSTNDVGNIASTLRIGTLDGSSSFLNGWLDEIRISKGIARWTANFTPPSSAYAADVVTFALANYAPELLTLDVAPGGSGWAAGDTVTGNTSAATCIIVEVLTTTTYRVKDRSGTYTLGEILTNGTVTADQGAANPTLTGDPFGADGSDDCPACVTIHEQRIFFANTNNNPQKVWGSVAGDYEDMTAGSNAGDALSYTIGSTQVNAIRWLSSGRVLGIGTLGSVFSLSSGDTAIGITPTNVLVKQETSYGALGIKPEKIGNFVYYIQRNGKIVREFGYSYDIDEYKSNDATILAEHITGNGITEMAYQQSPYNILWCVRSDGQLCCLTRQMDQEVIAWARQILGGSFGSGNAVVESVAVIPGDNADDQVWISVKRTINGATVRYIEYFTPMDWGSEQEDAFFVDSGLSLDSPKTITGISKANPGVVTAIGHGFSNGNIVIIRGVKGMTEVNRKKYKIAGVAVDTFQLTDPDDDSNIDSSAYTAYSSSGEVRKCVTSLSGLSHLEGETIDLLLDGDTAVTKTVSSGAVTLTSPGGGEIHAGLRFTPYLKTMRIEAGSQIGTAQGKKKRINKVTARVYETLKLKVGNSDIQDEFDFREEGDTSGDVIAAYSGDLQVLQPGLWDRDGYVVITQTGPYPSTIIALIVHLTTSDYD